MERVGVGAAVVVVGEISLGLYLLAPCGSIAWEVLRFKELEGL
jgi:hypothetical protein